MLGLRDMTGISLIKSLPSSLKTNFYKSSALYLYDKSNVLYMAYVGKYNNRPTYKYGITKDIYTREMKAHRKNFEMFDMRYIYKTNHNAQLEELLEKELKIRGVHCSMKINNKQQTELFQPSKKFSLSQIHTLILDMQEHLQKKDEDDNLERSKLELQIKTLEYKIEKLKQL